MFNWSGLCAFESELNCRIFAVTVGTASVTSLLKRNKEHMKHRIKLIWNNQSCDLFIVFGVTLGISIFFYCILKTVPITMSTEAKVSDGYVGSVHANV